MIDTVPSVSDWGNPELQPFLEKYLKGKADVPTENRLRLFRLLQDLTTYGIGCYWLTLSAVGAGSPQGTKIMIQRETDFGFKERLAKALAGIPSKRPRSMIYLLRFAGYEF